MQKSKLADALPVDRRQFLQLLAAAGFAVQQSLGADVLSAAGLEPQLPKGAYTPGRIQNDYALFLPGEREALATAPAVRALHEDGLEASLKGAWQALKVGRAIDGWQLVTIAEMNGVATAVFEKHATHQGALAYVTALGGTLALVPKQVGELSSIRPRAVSTPDGIRLSASQVPGPDIAGNYVLHSDEDPCYENVAALGPEYIGWSLVANEQGGPLTSLYLDAAGKSRQPVSTEQALYAPDMDGAEFDPGDFLPFSDPRHYSYQYGYSKRTLLGGYLPIACTGVWNTDGKAGYEVIVLLPPGDQAKPMARVRVLPNGAAEQVHFWNCRSGEFYENVLGIWNHWSNFYENTMPVDIPDPWLLNAARAGITLCRCSYRGLNPTYQIGEGGYTKIPERSHALFPVAAYEFIWAHQIWGLTESSDPYFQHYLDSYILPDGNFLYNTQDQVEGPLNAGLFLWNSARAYQYTRDVEAFRKRLPVLERILGYVLARYEFSLREYAPTDRRYGLIWGSPEADLGDPNNDTPNAHPFYYQNAACVWRGLHEHAAVLSVVGRAEQDTALAALGERYAQLAGQMRGHIQTSMDATIAAGNQAMRRAGITPFETNDTERKPDQLSSYENHRFMMDWFLADWGLPALDLGYLNHRLLAGEQICGLNTDGDAPRTSNFMSHGTLAVRIRQDDYRPFLLTLYALVCYAADSGNRYSPEDAYIPGSYPGDGGRYGWSAVVNSTLQPTLGLRWMLCYEESDRPLCHLQKAAPKHWFADGERIRVKNCPTRWGTVSWTTTAKGANGWEVEIQVPQGFVAELAIHIHPPDGHALRTASAGTLMKDRIVLASDTFAQRTQMILKVS
jgi:hypothetical protein